MNDDTERRLREVLDAAVLPDAPQSLRASMRAIASGSVPAASRGRRPWLRALPALAVVVVIVVAVGVASGALGRHGPAVSSSSPSSSSSPGPSAAQAGPSETPFPTPTIPPSPAAPSTSVKLVDAAALMAAIREVQGGVVGAHDVVVNVGADPGRKPAPTVRECADPLGSCTVVAVLDGFDDTTGVVTTRAETQTLPPPVTPADLTAPLALRLVPGGPIELLGHVDLAPPAGYLDTVGLKQLTATAAPDRVVAVLAWLSGVNGMSCGPVRPSDVPSPFACPGDPSFLNDQPVLSAVIDDHPSPEPGSSITPTRVITGSMPDSAVLVQAFAYNSYAPSPSISDGVNGDPRQGVYLVRMVAVDNADCPKCRGWLMVGRLDAQPPTASTSDRPNAGQRVYSAAELEAVLTASRASLVGKPVFVDGSIDTSIKSACLPDMATCPLGWLTGTTEVVSATPYTGQLLEGGTDLGAQGVMAMVVRESGLEYLGSMGYGGQGVDFQAPVSQLAGDFSGNPPLLTFIVSGWLGTSGPLPCPSVPGSPPPADTPFGSGCPYSWLGPTSAANPSDSVPVQYSAYDDFARASGGSGDPVQGTFLVRLVADTRQGINGPRGWQVVARLAP